MSQQIRYTMFFLFIAFVGQLPPSAVRCSRKGYR